MPGGVPFGYSKALTGSKGINNIRCVAEVIVFGIIEDNLQVVVGELSTELAEKW